MMVMTPLDISVKKSRLESLINMCKHYGCFIFQVGIDMSRYPSFATEFQFVERMVAEESVFCLPGKVSHTTNCAFK